MQQHPSTLPTSSGKASQPVRIHPHSLLRLISGITPAAIQDYSVGLSCRVGLLPNRRKKLDLHVHVCHAIAIPSHPALLDLAENVAPGFKQLAVKYGSTKV